MKITIASVVAAVAVVLGVGLPLGTARAMSAHEVPVPDNLLVPPGHVLFLDARAVGTQNYVCLPTAKRTVGWRFIGPEATVFLEGGDGAWQQVTTHFLSANPDEGLLARPTWQHSTDTSRVWGRLRASSTDPNYVEPGAIAWLLLEAAGAELGPTGGASLTQTTFIQRVNTSGGVAPAAGCTDDDHIGAVALVPYTTDYLFYRAAHD